MRRAVALLAGSLVFLACDGPDLPGGDPDAAPAPVLDVTYGDWTLSEAPVFPRGAEGAWDDGLVDPGAIVFHEGRFHMLYNGIRSWPAPLSVGYATSTDGLRWERQTTEPVFAPDPVPFGGWTVRATSALVEDDTWNLYFAVGEEGALEGVVGRATAPGPTGPWEVDPEPVLTPGTPDDWDGERVGHAKVLPDAGGYVMYYTGWGGGPSMIGRATSRDGVQWARDPQPVLEPPVGESDADEFQVSDPTVIRTPDAGWLMSYRLSGPRGVALGVASSRDGKRWIRDAPAVRAGAQVPFDFIFYSSLQATRSHQMIYFEGSDPDSDETDVWVTYRTVRVAPPGDSVRSPDSAGR